MVNLIRYHASIGSVGQLMFDAGLFVAALVVAILLQATPVFALQLVLPAAILFGGAMVAVSAAFGLYRRQPTLDDGAFIRRAILAMLVGFPVAYSIYFLYSPGVVLHEGTPYFVLFVLSLAIVLRKPLFARTATTLFPRRILVVGAGPDALEVERTARELPEARLTVVGFAAVPSREEPIAVPLERLMPPGISIPEAVRRLNVNEIVVTTRERRGGALPVDDLLACRALGVRVTDLPRFCERMRGEMPIEALKASWLIYGEGFRQGLGRRAVKRAFDIVMSAVLLVLALPVMIATAIAIRLESPGPVVFRQERVGRGGRTFTIFKFRSMRSDAEADGRARWAAANDHRVTRVGRFIRKVRIDELPQLLNVLRGEMSLIGPRPERPAFVAELTKELPFYALRHTVHPGLTGWAQVRFEYGASIEDAKRKLQFDLYYVKHHSLFLDLIIAIETVRVVLSGKGGR